MTALVTALYAEGNTDERFLPIVIQRTAVDLISRYGHTVVDVHEPMLVAPPQKSSRAENIAAVARQAAGYHLLFIHADADGPTADRAHSERIQPGIDLIAQADGDGEQICTDVVPVIPVQMTEAWMLVDHDVLLDLIGTTMQPYQVTSPGRVQQIETVANPKAQLMQIMQSALDNRPRRVRRQRSISELYEPLGRRIALGRLALLPSYQKFVADFTQALALLNFIR